MYEPIHNYNVGQIQPKTKMNYLKDSMWKGILFLNFKQFLFFLLGISMII